MKTLSILKVFFRLKHEELKKAHFYIWFPFILNLFITPLFFYKTEWWLYYDNLPNILKYFNAVGFILMSYGGLIILFVIIMGFYELFKWIRSNWQKAKKEVEGK